MISLDTLRFLRKKKFWIAIAGVCVLMLMMFGSLSKSSEAEYRQLSAEAINNKNGTDIWYIEDEAYIAGMQNNALQLEQGIKKKDWKKINQSFSEMYLMKADRVATFASADNPDFYYHDYLKNKDEVERLLKKHNLKRFTKEMLPLNWVETSIFSIPVTAYPYYQFQARYYEKLNAQGVEQLTYSTCDSSTLFLQFIRMMFPLLPILLIVLLCSDSFQEDRDSGVIKVLMTQPIRRTNYIRKKIMLNIKSVLFIFLVPVLVFSLGFGLFDHYKTLRSPVLVNEKGLTSLSLVENTMAEMELNNIAYGKIGLSKYAAIPCESNSPNVDYEFMEMWQVVGLGIVMMVLVLVFISLVNTFLCVIIRNKTVALVISALILLVGAFLSPASNTEWMYSLSPFTYMNPVDILTGFSSYTYLNGILVLSACNIFLYFLTLQIYKRKDVIC